MKPHPFVKWAGGKTQLLPELLKRIPSTWNRETDPYCELFVGAGALFWELQPKHAVLNDANMELMSCWRALCDVESTNVLMTRLKDIRAEYARDPEALYYRMRELTVRFQSALIAARFIFLNKAGFNGLYRVNASSGFNVPWGQNPDATILDEENLRACSNALQAAQVELHCVDFADSVAESPPPAGSLVYLDPPYVPVSKTSDFTAYTAGGFPYVDQLRLVQFAAWLKHDLKCHVVLSQAADKSLGEQYRRCGFQVDRVKARRNINSKATKRGPVGEYIIY